MGNLAIAALVASMAYGAMALSVRIALNRRSKVASRITNRADDFLVEVLSGTGRLLTAMVALLIGVGMLDLPDRGASRVG